LADCSGLKSVIVDAKLKIIKEYTFSDCSSLETISLPAGICSIEEEVFSGCDALKCIYVPSSEIAHYKELLPEEVHPLIIDVKDN
jgi:hypothetical protein